MSYFRKFLAVAIIGASLVAIFVLVPHAQAARINYSFDSGDVTSEITNNFTAAPSGTPYTVAADTGINETNALDTNNKNNLWTTQDTYMEVGDHIWATSALFHNVANSGYGALGFTDQASNDITEGGLPDCAKRNRCCLSWWWRHSL